MTPRIPERPVEWSDCLPPTPVIGQPVQTACGSMIIYTANTPCVQLQGENVYFCHAVCKCEFERDPRQSCVNLGALRR
jgi:YHS domain-containing protein